MTLDKLLKDTESSARLAAIVVKMAEVDDWNVAVLEGMCYSMLNIFCDKKGLDAKKSLKRIGDMAGKETE